MLQQQHVAAASAFVIARSAYAAALRKRLCGDPSITVFSEAESLDALRQILAHPPKILALDSSVVRTARGALLVSRLKAHDSVDVRVLTDDDENMPILLGHPNLQLHAASHPLEGCGTRAARRFAMGEQTHVVIDGERSQLVNLSVTGAQVILPTRVQPRQHLRFALPSGAVDTRLMALVAWSAAELGKGAVRYRAGLVFVDPPTQVLEAFCLLRGAKA